MGNCSSRKGLLSGTANSLPPAGDEPVALQTSNVTADFALSPVAASTKSEKEKASEDVQFATLGAGCYWGTSKFISTTFPKTNPPGKILNGEVGFMGPKSAPANPSYEDVCTGKTGHVEVYNVQFSGGDEMYEAIIRYFFQFHDPTTLNRQGNDSGTQYASVIYCHSQSQFDIATRVKNQVQVWLNSGAIKGAYQSIRITTDVRMASDASPFFAAEEKHQDYLTKNPNGYCNHRIRIASWPGP